jgi:hypothetical protein
MPAALEAAAEPPTRPSDDAISCGCPRSFPPVTVQRPAGRGGVSTTGRAGHRKRSWQLVRTRAVPPPASLLAPRSPLPAHRNGECALKLKSAVGTV